MADPDQVRQPRAGAGGLRVALLVLAAAVVLGGGFAIARATRSSAPNIVITGADAAAPGDSAPSVAPTDAPTELVTTTVLVTTTSPDGSSQVTPPGTTAAPPQEQSTDYPTTTAGPAVATGAFAYGSEPFEPTREIVTADAALATQPSAVVVTRFGSDLAELGQSSVELRQAPDKRFYVLAQSKEGPTIDWIDTTSGERSRSTLAPEDATSIVGPSRVLYRVSDTEVQAIPMEGQNEGTVIASAPKPSGISCANAESGIGCGPEQVMDWVGPYGGPLNVLFGLPDTTFQFQQNDGKVTLDGEGLVTFPNGARLQVANLATAFGEESNGAFRVQQFQSGGTSRHCARIVADVEQPRRSLFACMSNSGRSKVVAIDHNLIGPNGTPIELPTFEFLWVLRGTSESSELVRFELP